MMAAETALGTGRVVVLTGGPPEIPRLYELPSGAGTPDPSRVVVAFYGRHHRFEATGRTVRVGGALVAVFAFAYSTAIAE